MELIKIDPLVIFLTVFVGPLIVGFGMIFFGQLGEALNEFIFGNILYGLKELFRLGFFLVFIISLLLVLAYVDEIVDYILGKNKR